jgi:hypothetical protein
MESSRASSGLERSRNVQAITGSAVGGQTTLTPLVKMLRTIPPERVGLHGEYDHSGLAKRVTLAFTQHFDRHDVANLRISQRGTVVVLVGRIPNQRLLNRMINVALSTSGAADVEVNGVSVIEPQLVCAAHADSLSHSSYAC